MLEFYSVRQIHTADVTRNLLKSEFNIFYPQISYAGPGPTYILLEFPLYNAIVAIFYYFFGVAEIFGRLLSILFFLLSSMIVYKIAKKIYGLTTGLLALFLFNFYPIGILASRTFIPDNLMILFSLLSVWYAIKIKERFTNYNFLILCSLISLTILTKFQGFFTLIPVSYLLLTEKGEFKVKIKRFFLMLFLSLLLPFLWYFRDFLVTIYGSSQYFKDSNWADPKYFLDLNFYRELLRMLYLGLTQTGLFLMILGFLVKTKRNEGFLKFWVLSILLLFLIFDRKSSSHEYYQLVILPIAALFGAKVLDLFFRLIHKHLASSLRTTVLVTAILFIYLSLASVIGRAYVIGPRFLSAIPASKLVQKYTAETALIIDANDIGAQPLYYSKRRGWSLDLSNDSNPNQTVLNLKMKGAEYLVYIPPAYKPTTVSNEGFFSYLSKNFTLIDQNEGAYLFHL